MCSSTAAATIARASSSATWAMATAGNGRRACGQHALDLLDLLAHRDRRAGAAVGDALAQGVDVLLDRRPGRRAKRASSVSSPSGVSAIWYCAISDRHGLRAGDVVDRRAGTASARAPRAGCCATRISMSRVITCSGSSPAGSIASASASVARYARLVGRAPVRAEVRQAVVEAVVAEDGGEDRVALEDAVPETVGELVDGGVGIGGQVTGAWSPKSGRSAAALSVAGHRPPNRSASRAGGVSSSWS